MQRTAPAWASSQPAGRSARGCVHTRVRGCGCGCREGPRAHAGVWGGAPWAGSGPQGRVGRPTLAGQSAAGAGAAAFLSGSRDADAVGAQTAAPTPVRGVRPQRPCSGYCGRAGASGSPGSGQGEAGGRPTQPGRRLPMPRGSQRKHLDNSVPRPPWPEADQPWDLSPRTRRLEKLFSPVCNATFSLNRGPVTPFSKALNTTFSWPWWHQSLPGKLVAREDTTSGKALGAEEDIRGPEMLRREKRSMLGRTRAPAATPAPELPPPSGRPHSGQG